MSNTKHTPGPWQSMGGFISTTEDEPTVISGLPRIHKKHTRIYDEPFGGYQNGYEWPTSVEAEANARLIAAAPELLDALQVMAKIFEGLGAIHNDAYRQASAAIAKATGTTL